MKEMIKEFMELVDSVRVMAEFQVLDVDEYWEENYDAMEEIDCMKEHCEACLRILESCINK